MRVSCLKLWILPVAILMAGCQILDPPDRVATLQAQNEGIVREATAIAGAASADRRRVQATAVSAMTQAASLQMDNLDLLATVRAGDPPRPRVVANTDLGSVTLTPGQRWFIKTGVSRQVNEVDGCVISPEISFPADVPVIYTTMRGFNVEAGLQLSVLWTYEGAEVHRESFSLTRSWPEVCLWFSLDSSIVDLLPGNWTAQLFADGAGLEAPVAFTIRAAEADMEG